MRESFYHYMRNLRDPNKNDEVTRLAYAISQDNQFPRTATDYDGISRYLEMQTDYVPNMDLFDRIWMEYQDKKRSV